MSSQAPTVAHLQNTLEDIAIQAMDALQLIGTARKRADVTAGLGREDLATLLDALSGLCATIGGMADDSLGGHIRGGSSHWHRPVPTVLGAPSLAWLHRIQT